MITVLYRLLTLVGRWSPAARTGEPFRHKAHARERTRRLRVRPHTALRRVTHLHAVRSDAGMTTAEYAVGTVAAVAFAVVLFKVVQSPAVHSALVAVVTGALRVHM